MTELLDKLVSKVIGFSFQCQASYALVARSNPYSITCLTVDRPGMKKKLYRPIQSAVIFELLFGVL